MNQLAIPERAVLLLQQQQPARSVQASIEARRVEVHERKQRRDLGNGADRMLLEQPRQADSLFAQLVPDQPVRLGRAVAFREEQVEDLEYRRKPRRELPEIAGLGLRDAFAQCRARSLQALVDRLTTLEQPQSDLLHAESTEDPQREDDLRLARDARVGAHEE